MADPYEILQVHPRADQDVLRAAYRVLARKYHPDHGGDARKMIDLNDAWGVLGDPDRRAAYDASCAAVGAAAPGSPGSPAGSAASAAPAASAAAPKSAGASSRSTDVAHAGSPPGRPSGTVLDFGRYSGWSLGEIARHDLDYLEWLQRSTLGRGLRAEIEGLLAPRRSTGARATSNRPWGR